MTTREKLNDLIKAHCVAAGIVFKPWEIPPWEADDGASPYPRGTAGAATWPKAQALRRKIIAALAASASAEGED